MFLSSLVLPLPLDAAVAFLAGGAAGIALTRVSRPDPARATPSL